MEKLVEHWTLGAWTAVFTAAAAAIVGGLILFALQALLGPALGWRWAKYSAILWAPLVISYVVHHIYNGE